LELEDYVFPAMGTNGVVQPHEPLFHDTIQRWINEATTGATIQGSFSIHCGAQYRFMFAPVDLRLITVLFFQRDTLIWYLLDELHIYETNYSDALAPVPCNANNSLMGEATLIQPVSAEEL
ncbi:hypothetical protein HD554DRAFT_2006777, partial [Boletus coccyginus]